MHNQNNHTHIYTPAERSSKACMISYLRTAAGDGGEKLLRPAKERLITGHA
jgi:hypothetical protein